MEQQVNTQDILFQGSYTMTYDDVNDFYLFTSQRCYWWMTVLKWLVTAYLVVNILGAILMSIILDIFDLIDLKHSTGPIAVMLIFGIFVFVTPLISKNQQMKNLLNNVFIKDSHVNYYFYQDRFVYNTEQTSAMVYYNQLYDIHETSKCFLLYIAKNTGYIVPKRTFIAYTSEDLRGFVKGKVGTKFGLHSK